MTGSSPGIAGVPLAWRVGRTALTSPDDAQVWLFGGRGPVRLAGRGCGAMARAVDGRRDLAGIVTAGVAAGLEFGYAQRMAAGWLQRGHLAPAVTATAPQVRVQFIDRADRPEVAARLGSALELAGLGIVREAGESSGEEVVVVLMGDLLDVAGLGLPGRFIGISPWQPRAMVSPLLGTGAGCPACLVARMSLRRSAELVAAQQVGLARPPTPPECPPGALVACAGVVAAVLSPAADLAHASGEVAVIDPSAGSVRLHQLVPRAGCPECDPDGVVVMARHLELSTLTAVADAVAPAGDDAGLGAEAALRAVDPDITWARYQHLISDTVGVVPHVSQAGPASLRAFYAGPNVAARQDPALMRSRLRSSSGGKGLSLAAARTGALAEALERDTLRARGDEPSVRARLSELPGSIHPNDIQLFSEAQLRQSEILLGLGITQEALGRGFQRVPSPFDAAAEHDWCPVSDLLTGERRWILASQMWLGWPGVPPGYPIGCSNGAAAGNTVAEALLSGLMELVERDAVALWWYPRARRPAFDLSNWDDPRILAAVAPQHALGTTAWVLDLTADTGIPAAVAVATGLPQLPDVPMLGFGAHLDPVVAVVRALAELAQMQAAVVGADHFDVSSVGPAEQDWFEHATVDSEPWLAPAGLVAAPLSPVFHSVTEALGVAVTRICELGLPVLWADCTRPDIGMPVVRTWVPGLRHFWARLAPGRLYDVPAKLGWCPPGYGEADLNPRVMFL